MLKEARCGYNVRGCNLLIQLKCDRIRPKDDKGGQTSAEKRKDVKRKKENVNKEK